MLQVNVWEPKRTTMDHLTERLTARFLFGRATGDEARTVVRHLLTQCPHCAILARRLLVKPPISNRVSVSPALSSPSLVGRETARISFFPEREPGNTPGHPCRRDGIPGLFFLLEDPAGGLPIAWTCSSSSVSLPAGRPALLLAPSL